MSFNTSLFLLYFFPLFLILYFLTPPRFKNVAAFAASILFYAWGAPKFVFVILGILVIDYWLGNRIYENHGLKRKVYLWASLALNISFLLYFKYFNFFADNMNIIFRAVGLQETLLAHVALPLGISFFSFQEMSYTIDIYRGDHPPLKRFTDYALFVFLFSHITAGPIVTYGVLANDLVDRRKKLNNDYRLQGFLFFFIGLAKKVLIADSLGVQVNHVYATAPENLSSLDCWLAGAASALQLYFDFAGYSDMAIGIGKLLGFDFPNNFDFPFSATSFSELWRRWNITLGHWLRSYLYIPMGGSRVGFVRHYFNLWFIFVVCGLWHGASWSGLSWGIYCGIVVVLESVFLLGILKKLPVVLRIAYVFIVSVLGAVFFRIHDMHMAVTVLGKLCSFHKMILTPGLYPSNKFIFYLVIAVFFSFAGASTQLKNRLKNFFDVKGAKPWALTSKLMFCLLLFVLCLAEIVSSDFTPFIYFKF
jgi:alginate O-acetyltransferase complex protein AlgI